METRYLLLLLIMGMFLLLLFLITHNSFSLNSIKAKPVGDGQHGNSEFATKKEIHDNFNIVPYTVNKWRNKQCLPKEQGIILGSEIIRRQLHAFVDTEDVHTIMIGAAGVGKTACFLYPNLEYACASGMSFLTTDTKGDLYRNYAGIAQKYYGYNVSIIDLRNPLQSNHFNMLHLVNKYIDLYIDTKDIKMKAKAEKYAKIISKTIIYSSGTDTNYGQNQFFYDSAEGLLTATILIISEFAPKEKRHIISVFKLIQDLMSINMNKISEFKVLINLLPENHKARWFAGSALNTSEQAMQSILSTALARLNAFLDSEMEQILCFETDIDAERFCNTKSAIFLVLPEEDNTKYFIVSLIIQQLYREILTVADEIGGKLNNRAIFFLDEIGTIPKIESIEMMFSAARSRNLLVVAIIQSFAQLDKNYGEKGSEIILDNCVNSIFGRFAPNSKTAEILSNNLGTHTVLSGSVTKGKGDSTQSLQMIERKLMTPEELKKLEKFHFIVTKAGISPIKTKMDLYFKWGISFEQPYERERGIELEVSYINKKEIIDAITSKTLFNNETIKKGVIKVE